MKKRVIALSVAAAMSAQGKGVAGVTGFSEEGHEGVGPHPAAGEGAVDEEQGRAAGFACRQAGKDLQAGDFFGFCHCSSIVGRSVFKWGSRRVAQVDMLKWILTLVIAIFLLGIVAPHVARFIRFGKLPGDIACRFRGRTYYLPFTTTILFSLILLLVSRFI